MLEETLFQKIINGSIPAFKIYEDDLCLAFFDIFPKSAFHTLIIPKKHTLDFYSVDEKTLFHMNRVVKKIANFYEDTLTMSGFSYLTNIGLPQEIKHFHLHLLPVYTSDHPLVHVHTEEQEQYFKRLTSFIEKHKTIDSIHVHE